METSTTSNSNKKKPLILYLFLVAAFLIIFFLIFLKKESSSLLLEAGIAQQEGYSFPDGSSVLLNAMTTIKYKDRNWEENRSIELEGEAFFTVESGNSPFSVITPYGSLRTTAGKFNIRAREGELQVVSFEGHIDVLGIDGTSINLPPMNVVHFPVNEKVRRWTTNGNAPNWVRGVSIFRMTLLHNVFREVERQFDVIVKHPVYQAEEFTGGFLHNDLERAIQTICSASGMTYKINGKEILIERMPARTK